MKFSAVILAAAVGVSANGYGYGNTNVTVVTEVVQSYTTYCPEATEITHGSKTYTVTEATTLTITDCPCTITKPVVPTSVVVCHTCGVFTNSTVATVPVTQGPPSTQVPSSVSAQPPVQTKPGQPPVTGGASKAFAGLAGVVGVAALIL